MSFNEENELKKVLESSRQTRLWVKKRLTELEELKYNSAYDQGQYDILVELEKLINF